MKKRALAMFKNSIKSDSTRENYSYHLQKFADYYKLDNIESILDIEDKDLQVMAEDFLFFHKGRGVMPNTIKPYFQALELFCVVNDKTGMNFKKIRKMYPADKKLSGKKPWTTKEIQMMLENATDIRTKVLIYILSSTGCRAGAKPELALRHISELLGEHMSILFYEGSNEEYYGFLTPEATKYVKSYLRKREQDGEQLEPDHPLLREKYHVGSAKPKFCSRGALQMLLHRVIERRYPSPFGPIKFSLL